MTARLPLEISVQTIGGPAAYPRFWGPTHCDAPVNGTYLGVSTEVLASHTASLWLRVGIEDLTELGGGWAGCILQLEDVNGWSIGRRPALLYVKPYDVPTVTSFYVPTEDMMFAVLIRRRTT